MIPRLLVPEKLSPVSATSTDGRKRVWTVLDDRLVIPSQLPIKPLQSESSIPAHLPLDVLGERTLIPRDAVRGTLDLPRPGEHLLPTDADERMAVPVDARPASLVTETAVPVELLEREDLVTTDVFTTGEVRLLPKQVSQLPSDRGWLMPAGSLVVHIVLALIIFGLALIVPHHEPSQAEMEATSRALSLYLPQDSMYNHPRAAPSPGPPSDRLRLDPGMLRRILPESIPAPVEPPQASPPRSLPELPSAPIPQLPQHLAPSPPARTPPASSPVIENARNTPPVPQAQIKLPSMSPGRVVEDSVRGASNSGNGAPGIYNGGSMRRGGGGGGSGGGGGNGYAGAGLTMLTPTQGVDFSGYLNRLYYRVKSNWFSAMPESALMGDRGRVVVQFRIERDGTILFPGETPTLSSTKPPLDNAAVGAIRAASPFEPLPAAFSGPYIELRFAFYYNYRPEEIE